MRYVELTEYSIDSLEMDYKRRLSLSCSPEAQRATKRFEMLYNGNAMIGD